MSYSRVTSDHERIRRWAQLHGAVPAYVFTESQDGEPKQLQFSFPTRSSKGEGKNLAPIGWDDFFAQFDLQGLALRYEEAGEDGELNNSNQLVVAGASRETMVASQGNA